MLTSKSTVSKTVEIYFCPDKAAGENDLRGRSPKSNLRGEIRGVQNRYFRVNLLLPGFQICTSKIWWNIFCKTKHRFWTFCTPKNTFYRCGGGMCTFCTRVCTECVQTLFLTPVRLYLRFSEKFGNFQKMRFFDTICRMLPSGSFFFWKFQENCRLAFGVHFPGNAL
jgi:hypothetical protein